MDARIMHTILLHRVVFVDKVEFASKFLANHCCPNCLDIERVPSHEYFEMLVIPNKFVIKLPDFLQESCTTLRTYKIKINKLKLLHKV